MSMGKVAGGWERTYKAAGEAGEGRELLHFGPHLYREAMGAGRAAPGRPGQLGWWRWRCHGNWNCNLGWQTRARQVEKEW